MKEILEAYWDLKQRAEQEGWHLILVSGYRSFWNQTHIWNEYEDAYFPSDDFTPEERVLKTMRAVSVPGLSRHQWGTDLDISGKALQGKLVHINSTTPKKVLEFYAWMEKNAPDFGFCRVYRGKQGVVRDEPWHWSYIPFAMVYQKQFRQIHDFSRIFKNRVGDVDYIQENFNKIFQRMMETDQSGCMR